MTKYHSWVPNTCPKILGVKKPKSSHYGSSPRSYQSHHQHNAEGFQTLLTKKPAQKPWNKESKITHIWLLEFHRMFAMPVDGFANQLALLPRTPARSRLFRPFSLCTHLHTHRYMEEDICFTQWIFHVLTVDFWCRALNSPLCCHIPWIQCKCYLFPCTHICVRLWGMANLVWCVFPRRKMRSMEAHRFQTKTYVEFDWSLQWRIQNFLDGGTNTEGR